MSDTGLPPSYQELRLVMGVLIDTAMSTGPVSLVQHVLQHVPDEALGFGATEPRTPGACELAPTLLAIGVCMLDVWYVALGKDNERLRGWVGYSIVHPQVMVQSPALKQRVI